MKLYKFPKKVYRGRFYRREKPEKLKQDQYKQLVFYYMCLLEETTPT